MGVRLLDEAYCEREMRGVRERRGLEEGRGLELSRIGDSHGEALVVRSAAFRRTSCLTCWRVPWRLASVTHPGHPADRKAGRASNSRPHIFVGGDPGSCAIAAFVYAAIPDASIDQKGG